jgi:hypothetical protein
MWHSETRLFKLESVAKWACPNRIPNAASRHYPQKERQSLMLSWFCCLHRPHVTISRQAKLLCTDHIIGSAASCSNGCSDRRPLGAALLCCSQLQPNNLARSRAHLAVRQEFKVQ